MQSSKKSKKVEEKASQELEEKHYTTNSPEENPMQYQDQINKLKQENHKLVSKQKELESTIKSKDNLMTIIAHDLKNPFGVIMGLAELLYKKADEIDTEHLRVYTQEIFEASDQVTCLLENLLNWSRLQANTINLHPNEFSLPKLVNDQIILIKELTRKKSIDIEMNIEDSFYIMGDKNVLGTVIRNLVFNAVKFTNEKGTIVIQAEKFNSGFDISIQDNGVGISEGRLEGLFSMEKISSTQGTKGEPGSGLGLILCKELVELHGGALTVKSELGRGSEFRIHLPSNIN